MKSRSKHFAVAAISYAGPRSDAPLAFKHYDPAEVIDGKTLKEHLRFSIAYWHAFRGTGADPFGPGTIVRPWESGKDPVSIGRIRMDAAFEFFVKIESPFWCFHDRDIAPEGRTLTESNLRSCDWYLFGLLQAVALRDGVAELYAFFAGFLRLRSSMAT